MVMEKEQVWQILKTVEFPGFPGKSVLGAVKEVTIADNGEIAIQLAIAHFGRKAHEQVAEAIASALEENGALNIRFQIIEMPTPPVPEPAIVRKPIRHVLAVGSGKGGVGKSTMSVNLAVGLAQQGLRVGLLDADIFGPNVPRMLGVERLPSSERRGTITPAEAYGVKFVSVGLLVENTRAVVWRGPMLDKIMHQFLRGVAWGELDVLVVDLPPGTGDIPLSLAKHAEPDGAIVVVTPQEVALDDARKAITMFRRLDIPVVGVVENMSYFICDQCDKRHTLFGEGGGARLAEEMDTTLLEEIPMEPIVREGGDAGSPAVLREGAAGDALRAFVARVAEQVQSR
jgi:ATP-binding protein involved in chromosome partitioning